jgi:integrase
MPKTKRPPKYCKIGKYAVVYYNGKPRYIGLYGSPESKTAYSRLVAELRSNPVFLPRGETDITVEELAYAFLDHAKATLTSAGYTHYRITVVDFLAKLYGDVPVDNFTPKCLKTVRHELILSERLCRRMVNEYTRNVVTIFTWGVGEEYVNPNTALALKALKSLPKGYVGTFDNPEREEVQEDVVRRTLPFMPPTVRAMVQVQWLTGMRPSEVFNMKVGEINRNYAPDLWGYTPAHHKTEEHIGKKPIPLGKPEQELLAPYLEGKSNEAAVFSPATAMQERKAEWRACRKTKITPSQKARGVTSAAKPCRYNTFYNKDSYRQAVEYAIIAANKTLPEGEKIPHWFPYQLRHATATDIELKVGLDEAQAQLGHKTANMTRRYSKAQLKIREKLARERINPFDESD